jgi:hypothetical protein
VLLRRFFGWAWGQGQGRGVVGCWWGVEVPGGVCAGGAERTRFGEGDVGAVEVGCVMRGAAFATEEYVK